MGFFDVANGVLGIVGAGVGIKNAIDPPKEQGKAGQKTSQTLADEALLLSRGISDPNSQLFKNLAGQEEEAANNAFLQGLQRLIVQSNRERAKGGPGFFGLTNRRDEAIASALGTQRELATGEARNRARAALQNAASAAGFGVGASQVSGQLGQTNQGLKDDRFAGALGQIGAGVNAAEKALPAFEDLFGSSGGAPSVGTAPPGGIGRPNINNNPR